MDEARELSQADLASCTNASSCRKKLTEIHNREIDVAALEKIAAAVRQKITDAESDHEKLAAPIRSELDAETDQERRIKLRMDLERSEDLFKKTKQEHSARL